MKKPMLGLSPITQSFYIYDEVESTKKGSTIDVSGEKIDVTNQIISGLVELCEERPSKTIVFTAKSSGDKYELRRVEE